MQNEHVQSGFARRRSELAGQIEHAQAELRKLFTDLDAIDAAIRIFDPTAEVGEIKNRQYPPLHAASQGEMMWFVLGLRRVAEAPVTSREIADTVMDGRGLDKDDTKVAQMILKRVVACMWKIKQRRLVREVAIEGGVEGVDARVVGCSVSLSIRILQGLKIKRCQFQTSPHLPNLPSRSKP